MLDTWFRDLCSSYRSLRDKEKKLVRTFLNFDMKSPLDIAVQDRLALGFVEANRSAVVGELSAAATALIQSKPAEYETKSEGGRRRASMMAFSAANINNADSKSEPQMDSRMLAIQGSQLSQKFNTETKLPNRAIRRASSYDVSSLKTPGGAPLMRAHSNGDTPADATPVASAPKRRLSYSVSVPNAEVAKFSAPIDLPPIEDTSVIADSIDRPTQATVRNTLLEVESDEGRESSMLEEKLLRIGMKKSSSNQKSGCCTIL